MMGTSVGRLRALCLAAAAVLLLTGLGRIGLWAPDEPRYGQVAEEVRQLAHGPSDLVLLHLNGEPYDQKPPLYYWLAALAGAPGGRVTELDARLPSALAGIATVGLTIALGTWLFGPASGLLAGALLLTTVEFAHLGRRVALDVLLTFLEAAALVAFWRLDRGAPRRTRWLLAMHGAMGLAVLTKGPVGFLLPLLAIVAFLAWERRLREIGRSFPAWGLLLSIGPGLAWISAAILLAPKGFAFDAVWRNLIDRFFHGSSHARPGLYYFLQFPVVGLPWTVLWPLIAALGARRVLRADAEPGRARAWRFLLAWIGAMFVFFSVSSGKRGLYMLPALPAAALLCADAVVLAAAARASWPRFVSALLGASGLLLAGGALLVSFHHVVKHVDVPRSFGVAAAASIALAFFAWRWLGRRLAGSSRLLAQAAVVPAAVLALELAVFVLLFPAFDAEKSPRPIAEAAAAQVPPDGAIGLVGSEGLLGGLVYYGHRPVRQLLDDAAVADFAAAGGQAIVVQKKELERVTRVVPVQEISGTRAGRRSILVVRPLPPSEGKPAGP